MEEGLGQTSQLGLLHQPETEADRNQRCLWTAREEEEEEEGGDERAGNSQLPRVCRGDDKDGGLPGRRFLGLLGRLRLPYLLLKTVQLPPQPRYGAVFRDVVFGAVAALTCKVETRQTS